MQHQISMAEIAATNLIQTIEPVVSMHRKKMDEPFACLSLQNVNRMEIGEIVLTMEAYTEKNQFSHEHGTELLMSFTPISCVMTGYDEEIRVDDLLYRHWSDRYWGDLVAYSEQLRHFQEVRPA